MSWIAIPLHSVEKFQRKIIRRAKEKGKQTTGRESIDCKDPTAERSGLFWVVIKKLIGWNRFKQKYTDCCTKI